jgi:hypothetical protein
MYEFPTSYIAGSHLKKIFRTHPAFKGTLKQKIYYDSRALGKFLSAKNMCCLSLNSLLRTVNDSRESIF